MGQALRSQPTRVRGQRSELEVGGTGRSSFVQTTTSSAEQCSGCFSRAGSKAGGFWKTGELPAARWSRGPGSEPIQPLGQLLGMATLLRGDTVGKQAHGQLVQLGGLAISLAHDKGRATEEGQLRDVSQVKHRACRAMGRCLAAEDTHPASTSQRHNRPGDAACNGDT